MMKYPCCLVIFLLVFTSWSKSEAGDFCQAGSLRCPLDGGGYVQTPCGCGTPQGILQGSISSDYKFELHISYHCFERGSGSAPPLIDTNKCPEDLITNIKIAELDNQSHENNVFYIGGLRESKAQGNDAMHDSGNYDIIITNDHENIKIEIPDHHSEDNKFMGNSYQNEAFADKWTSAVLAVTDKKKIDLRLNIEYGGFDGARCFPKPHYCRYYHFLHGSQAQVAG
jgi:hypothetical protein